MCEGTECQCDWGQARGVTWVNFECSCADCLCDWGHRFVEVLGCDWGHLVSLGTSANVALLSLSVSCVYHADVQQSDERTSCLFGTGVIGDKDLV